MQSLRYFAKRNIWSRFHKQILLVASVLGVAIGLLNGWIIAGDRYDYCNPSGVLNYLIGLGSCTGGESDYNGRSFVFGLAGLLIGGGAAFVLIAVLRTRQDSN